MLIRATNGDKMNVFQSDQFSVKILSDVVGGSLLFLNTPAMDSLDIHYSKDITELNWLSDALAAALLSGREYFDAEQELKKFRPNDPESITKSNTYRIFELASKLRYTECSEKEVNELADELIRLTGICPNCDGFGEIPEEDRTVDCDKCGGKGVILPRPSPEDEYGEMPF